VTTVRPCTSGRARNASASFLRDWRRAAERPVSAQLCAIPSVPRETMKKLIAMLVVTACAVASTAVAATYSTEATMTRQLDKGTYEVVVRVSQLVERNGTVTEDLISQPKITSSPGVPASLYSGLQPSDRDYKKKENVSVDVSWPEAGKRDFAICTVVVKLGDKIVSKARMRVTVEEK